jgi:hypothetical protein
MLCYRCEYRARYLERESERKGFGHAPRFECKVDGAVHSCYMFKPVQPLVVEPSEYEKRLEKEQKIKRPIGGLVGARMIASEEQPEFEVKAKIMAKDRYLLYNELKK